MHAALACSPHRHWRRRDAARLHGGQGLATGLTPSRPGTRRAGARFTIPAEAKAALLGDNPRATIRFAINWGTCPDKLYLDNVRFSKNLAPREVFHVRGSESYDVVVPSVWSFDNVEDWGVSNATSSVTLRQETTEVVEGEAAVAVGSSGWTSVESAPFFTSELSGVTELINLDVFIEEPQPNRYWVGDVQMHLTCTQGLDVRRDAYLGYEQLTNRFEGEFNSLVFEVPLEMLPVLNGEQGTFSCRIAVAVNVSNAGEAYLDNLGFVQ